MRHRLDATPESFESPRIAPRIAKDKPLGRTQAESRIGRFEISPYSLSNIFFSRRIAAARGETENIPIALYRCIVRCAALSFWIQTIQINRETFDIGKSRRGGQTSWKFREMQNNQDAWTLSTLLIFLRPIYDCKGMTEISRSRLKNRARTKACTMDEQGVQCRYTDIIF